MIKQRAVTFGMNFFAEAIILFLLLLPLTYAYYSFFHYSSYVLIVFIISFCFYFIENQNLHESFYVIPLIITYFLLSILKFPLGIIVLLPLFLFWRYISIRSYKRFDYSALYLHSLYGRYERNIQKRYFHITLYLAFIVFILTKEFYVFFLALIQFIVLLGGFFISHFFAMGKKERKALHLKAFGFIPVVFLIIIVFNSYYYSAFQSLLKNIWYYLLLLSANVATLFAYLVNLLLPNFKRYEMTEKEQKEWAGGLEEAYKNRLIDISTDEADFTMLYIFGSLLVMFLLVILILRSLKRGVYNREMVLDQRVSYEEKHIFKRQKFNPFHRIKESIFQRSLHPVRKLLLDFEREAHKKGFGRRPYESLEEWFKRLDFSIHVKAYEKVRYGEKDITKRELKDLQRELQSIRGFF